MCSGVVAGEKALVDIVRGLGGLGGLELGFNCQASIDHGRLASGKVVNMTCRL